MKLRIYLATGNAHKVREIAALAEMYPLTGAEKQSVTPLLEIVAPEHVPVVVEDTGTFVGNARKKARALRGILPSGSWVLADDSGLGVEALDGGPGVESAYYAGPQGDPAANLKKLTEVMHDVPDEKRRAHFYCVLVLLGPGGVDQVFEGRCEGRLGHEPGGGGGFGYDPLFIPDGQTQTYAELGDAMKNRIGHRARAWMELVAWLSARQTP